MRRFRRARFADSLTLVDVLVGVVVVLVLVGLICSCGRYGTSQRTMCLSKLKQIAVALQAYCTDYDHFPCYPAYGSDPQPLKGEHWNLGLYADPHTGEAVRTGNREYYAGPSRYRCVFYGSRLADRPGFEMPPFERGRLNVAPIGLGHLVEGGYSGDARILFCPAARRVPKMEGYGALTEIDELERVGGFNFQELSRGDYAWADSYYTGQSDRGVLSSYNYRNVPLAVDPGAKLTKGGVEVPYTAPAVYAQPGCPMFKTQKLLGNRALLCDSFDRPSKPLWDKGFAQYAHGDGYNVLYGDWACKWYDDGAKKLLEMPWPAGRPVDASQGSDVCYAPATPTDNTGIVIWNLFDMSLGIDIH